MFVVAGTFDKYQGKTSYIGNRIISHLNCDGMNGGNINELSNLDFSKFDSILWMPNIDNSEDKILPDIKRKNPKCFLISSKRSIEKEYNLSDLVGRLLRDHCNLGILISKEDNYKFELIDPLGNIFCSTNDIKILCDSISDRWNFVKNLSRYPSLLKEGEMHFEVPQEFINIIEKYGNIFSAYVNAVNPNRFLGNASTRCSYGFPSFKQNDKVLVSRRNVDKTNISSKDFVAVELINDKVYYYGENKPSVDSPIQLKLFNYYNKINYIIHGHVYIEGALTTKNKLPCGSVEEFEEIKELFSNNDLDQFCVNLKGHGCLILAKNLNYFNEINLIARPFPEN